jgi:hypothetical protein
MVAYRWPLLPLPAGPVSVAQPPPRAAFATIRHHSPPLAATRRHSKRGDTKQLLCSMLTIFLIFLPSKTQRRPCMALRLKAIVCAVLPALLAISVAAEETVAGADRGYDTFNTKPEHKLGWTPTGFVADSRGTRHILPPSLSAAAPSSGCGCLLKPCDCPPDTDVRRLCPA